MDRGGREIKQTHQDSLAASHSIDLRYDIGNRYDFWNFIEIHVCMLD